MKTYLVVILVLCSLCPGAFAADYIPPSWPDLLRALVRLKALDLNDDTLIDQYAEVTDCDVYKTLYNDDFKWNKVRDIMRQSVRMNIDNFPTNFGYETAVDLDRYDFNQKAYLFTPATAIQNINIIVLFEYRTSPCDNKDPFELPKIYRALLDRPLTLVGMPITQKDGEALLQRMVAEGNLSHRIYARINMTVTYVEPWLRQNDPDKSNPFKSAGASHYRQAKANDPHSLRLDVRLDSIDFFEDQAMTRLIHEIKT